MKKLLAASIISLAVQIPMSVASVIAIVDSGNDFLHKDLRSNAWSNLKEIPNNDRDEDKNGYPDDVNGWNFAENNSMLIDYSYQSSDTEDNRRFFEIQLKNFLGKATEEDRVWVRTKFEDKEFIKNLTIFANWMHGTHVTGISVKNSSEAKALGIKLLPTEVKMPGKKLVEFAKTQSLGVKDTLIKAGLKALVSQQTSTYLEIGKYINAAKADVMNGSFGTPYSGIENLIKTVYKTIMRKDPSEEELSTYVHFYFETSIEETKKFLQAAPSTLFVFAAGNEGTNNDIYPTVPTNVVAENKISVAATLGDQELANFSCFGENNVEVAAPGVGIVSTTPMDTYLAISGTSQAAPYVANIAGAVKDANPKLSAKEIKRIIMETVDVKPWLKGKVKTSGLVNRERAIEAARLSRSYLLSAAISESKLSVAEYKSKRAFGQKFHQLPKEMILPMPNPLSIVK